MENIKYTNIDIKNFFYDILLHANLIEPDSKYDIDLEKRPNFEYKFGKKFFINWLSSRITIDMPKDLIIEIENNLKELQGKSIQEQEESKERIIKFYIDRVFEILGSYGNKQNPKTDYMKIINNAREIDARLQYAEFLKDSYKETSNQIINSYYNGIKELFGQELKKETTDNSEFELKLKEIMKDISLDKIEDLNKKIDTVLLNANKILKCTGELFYVLKKKKDNQRKIEEEKNDMKEIPQEPKTVKQDDNNNEPQKDRVNDSSGVGFTRKRSGF